MARFVDSEAEVSGEEDVDSDHKDEKPTNSDLEFIHDSNDDADDFENDGLGFRLPCLDKRDEIYSDIVEDVMRKYTDPQERRKRKKNKRPKRKKVRKISETTAAATTDETTAETCSKAVTDQKTTTFWQNDSFYADTNVLEDPVELGSWSQYSFLKEQEKHQEKTQKDKKKEKSGGLYSIFQKTTDSKAAPEPEAKKSTGYSAPTLKKDGLVYTMNGDVIGHMHKL